MFAILSGEADIMPEGRIISRRRHHLPKANIIPKNILGNSSEDIFLVTRGGRGVGDVAPYKSMKVVPKFISALAVVSVRVL